MTSGERAEHQRRARSGQRSSSGSTPAAREKSNAAAWLVRDLWTTPARTIRCYAGFEFIL